MRKFRMRNGMQIWNAPEAGSDTAFIFKEIYDNHCYEKFNVSVKDGDVVFDVGANIGLFALSLAERHNGLTIYCFEPVPNTRDCLIRNIKESPNTTKHEIIIRDAALGSHEEQAAIEFFPRAPGNSTMYSEDKRREFAKFDNFHLSDVWKWNRYITIALLPFYPLVRLLFRKAMRKVLQDSEVTLCNVMTLSKMICLDKVKSINLLKIDVEGAEMDVLAGLGEEHWPIVHQVVVEVAARNKQHINTLTHQLRSLGFQHLNIEEMAEGRSLLAEQAPCIVYAKR